MPALNDAPATPGLSAVASVVHFLVNTELKGWAGDTVIVSDTMRTYLCQRRCGPAPRLPPSWPDSIRQKADSAYVSYESLGGLHLMPLQAVAGLRARVAPWPDPTVIMQACREAKQKRCKFPTVFSVTAIGFNADSTYAMLETAMWCGFLCGDGYRWVLRRYPGHDWGVLWEEMTWVS